jgi:LCP family protein required for cell wall assembly
MAPEQDEPGRAPRPRPARPRPAQPRPATPRPATERPAPEYTRYRSRRLQLPRREQDLGVRVRTTPGGEPPVPPPPPRRRRLRLPGRRWRRWSTRRRIVLGLLAAIAAWLLLSLLLFLISSHFERVSPPSNVAAALDPAGYPLTSANNILVLGSDRRQRTSREPGAEKSGPGRSDTIMLIRTGGGHAARLSIPRDTVVEIPGHGLQKINAAHAFGGPAESIEVIKHWLGIPINHLVEVNFENFPQLIDAMGGIDYSGGCVISRLDGGFIRGGYTLRLPAGTHHLNGKQALALARTRENLCVPGQNDIQREEHQQALFSAMKSALLSPTAFFRLPLIAWNAPPAIISDMSGPTLLGMFGALAISGTPATRVLKPTGATTLPDGSQGLTVSEQARRAAVAQFLSG